jgi:tRNA(fMet)-specific endonuclease VapC
VTRYILDTDHLSLQQRGHPQLLLHLRQIPPDELAITVITVEEQLRGRLAQIRSARADAELLQAYSHLRETVYWLGRFRILDFDQQAKQTFDHLCQQKVRIGTQDLRIAAIALSVGAMLVTRNQNHFGQIAGLRLVDWAK